MKITWDESKYLLNLDKHGLNFADFSLDLLKGAKFQETRLNRIKSIFMFQDRLVSLIFAPLGTEAIALISFRVASITERKFYYDI